MLSDDIDSLAEFLHNPPKDVDEAAIRRMAVSRLNVILYDAWVLERTVVPAQARFAGIEESERLVDFERARKRLGR